MNSFSQTSFEGILRSVTVQSKGSNAPVVSSAFIDCIFVVKRERKKKLLLKEKWKKAGST